MVRSIWSNIVVKGLGWVGANLVPQQLVLEMSLNDEWLINASMPKWTLSRTLSELSMKNGQVANAYAIEPSWRFFSL